MSDASERIGTGERDAAVAALKTHQAEGRIDLQEYEERAVQAGQARTWGDLDLVFADLPEPRPHPGSTPVPTHPAASGAHPAASGAHLSGGLLPEPYAWMVTAAAPLLAVILFFTTGSWLWFLVVPIVGVVVYGPGSGPDRHGRGRDRRNIR